MKWLLRGVLPGLCALPFWSMACEPLPLTGDKQGTFDASGSVCFTLPSVGENAVSAATHGVTDAHISHVKHVVYRTMLKNGPPDGSQTLLFSLPQRQASTLVLFGKPQQTWQMRWQITATAPLEHEQIVAPVSPRLQALARELAQGGSTEAFWQERTRSGTPLVEPVDAQHVRVTFLWRGARKNVFILGSPEGDHDPLFRLAGSDVWFRSYVVPADTLMQYKLAPDVPALSDDPREQRRAILVSAQADPLNPNGVKPGGSDRWDRHSLLDLAPQRHCTPAAMTTEIAHGTLTRHAFHSKSLNNTREIQIYRPARPAAWTLMLFDGNIYQDEYRVANIIDLLSHQGVLPPLNVVFIDSLDHTRRSKELPPNPLFADFMAHELVPWLATQGIRSRAAQTIVSGSSYGGIGASWVALRYPHHFANVLSLSGSYWWAPKGEPPSWLTREYQKAPRLPVRFWLQAGRFETHGPDGGIFDNTLEFEQVLARKGYTVSFHPSSSGHDYAAWCEAIVDGVRDLTATRAVATRGH